jgi:hypothetical protein
MLDERGKGKLHFNGPNLNESLDAHWHLLTGKLFEGQTWRAAVRFDSDWSNWNIPSYALEPIFLALRSNDIQLTLIIDEGAELKCHIGSIDELSEEGWVEIVSMDQPRCWVI